MSWSVQSEAAITAHVFPGDGRTGAVLGTGRVRESSVIEFEESGKADYVAGSRNGW
jgi:hypothetical protein